MFGTRCSTPSQWRRGTSSSMNTRQTDRTWDGPGVCLASRWSTTSLTSSLLLFLKENKTNSARDIQELPKHLTDSTGRNTWPRCTRRYQKKKPPDLPWPTVDCQSRWTAGEEQHTRLFSVDNETHRRCLLPRSPRAAHWQSDQKTRFRIWKQHCPIRMFSNPLHSRK